MIKRPSSRGSEKGNVFFTLFGAVAVVGVLGAGIMTTMRGPLSTMVEVNRRTQAEAEMQIAAKLVLLEATETLANGGDCDSDNFVEPLEYLDANPSPTGGGQLPSVVASNKIDPWGTEYGYCAWDAGPTIDDSGCDDDTSSSYERLDGTGDADETYTVIAIVSAGSDRTFDTTCVGGASPSVTKGSGSDDIIQSFTYQGAAANTGGLWNIKSGDPDTAEISKNIEAQGATFTDAVNLTAASAQLQLGASSLILPTDDTVGTGDGDCTLGNNLILRINDDLTNPVLEICDGANTSWVSVTAGYEEWIKSGNDIYYNVTGGNVGIGTTTPAYKLDVNGTLNASGNATLGGNLTVSGNADVDQLEVQNDSFLYGGLEVSGDTTLADTIINSAAGTPLTVQDGGSAVFVVEADGQVAIGGGTASDALDVTGDVHISGDFKLDNDAQIEWGSDTPNITGSSATEEITINADTTNVDSLAANSVGVSGAATVGTTLGVTGLSTLTGGATLGSTLTVSEGNFGVTGCADNEILKNNGGGSSWECATDLGAGSGSSGALDLGDVLTEGNDADGLDATNFDDLDATRLGADQFCDAGFSDCETFAELRDADQIQGTNIKSTIVGDTTTTGQLLVWNQGTSQWEVGDGSDINNVVAVDITFPLDVEGEQEIMELNTSGRTFMRYISADSSLMIGDNAGGGTGDEDDAENNIIIGRNAGDAADMSGDQNVFVGNSAGSAVTSGGSNVFIGYQAGMSITTTNGNTFVGRLAGRDNTGTSSTMIGYNAGQQATGGANTFVGSSAGLVSSGASNVFIGEGAGQANTAGAQNVFIGRASGDANTSSSNSVFVGYNTGTASTGSHNTFLGSGAGVANTTGTQNTFLGSAAGDNNTEGSRNIIIGSGADNLLATTDDYLNIGNTLLGDMGTNPVTPGTGDAALTLDGDLTVTGNIIGTLVGAVALPIDADDATSPAGVVIDINAGANNFLSYNGTQNTYLGVGGGDAITTGQDNATLGYNAGIATTDGDENVFIGSQAGLVNTEGDQNVFLGFEAGNTNTTGDLNILIGNSVVATTATTSSYLNIGNTIFGTMGTNPATAGTGDASITIDGDLTVSGEIDGTFVLPIDVESYDEVFELTSASKTFLRKLDTDNVLTLGIDAGGTLTDGAGDDAQDLVLIGTDTGKALTTGDNSVLIGHSVAPAATSSTNNVLIGHEAANSLSTGSNNTFLGYQTGNATTSGAHNVFIGLSAGTANDDGGDNTFVGSEAGSGNTSGQDNVFIGRQAGDNNTTGSRNIIIGSAIDNNAVGTSDYLNIGNALFGDLGDTTSTSDAGAALTVDGDLTVTGSLVADLSNSLPLDVEGEEEIMELNASSRTFMRYLDTDNVLAFGDNAGSSATEGGTGVQNTFIGTQAGRDNSTADYNTFVGYQAGTAITTGSNNTFMGRRSGVVSLDGASNTFMGAESGEATLSGSQNTFIGHLAGTANTSGSDVTAIGYNAGAANTTNSNSSFFGSGAGAASTGAGNSFFGYQAGTATVGGANNTFLGTSAGDNNTSGSRNIIIGSGIDNLTGVTSDYLNIGNAFYGTMGSTGTTNAGDAAFTVDGDLVINRNTGDTDGGDLTVDNDVSIGGDLTVSGTISGDINTIVQGDSDVTVTDSGSNGTIAFTTDGTEIARFDKDGDLGIGTTNPQKMLHLSGNAAGIRMEGFGPIIEFIDSNDSDQAWRVINDGNDDAFKFISVEDDLSTNAATRLTLQHSTGNVGIGTESPAEALNIVGDLLGQSSETDATAKEFRILHKHYTNAEESSVITQAISNATQSLVYIGGGSGDYNAATDIRFYTAANNTTLTGTEAMRIEGTGNVGIGTTGPDAPLDVLSAAGPQMRLTYTDGSAYTDFETESSGNLRVQPISGRIYLNLQDTAITTTADGSSMSRNGRGFLFEAPSNTQDGPGLVVSHASQPTSGDVYGIGAASSFAPTSGTATYAGLHTDLTINQTGGASGITRGVFVDPTLTAAADFRAVEMSNDEGFGIYQSGASATNYFAGNVGIGTTSPSKKLHITGGDALITTTSASQPFRTSDTTTVYKDFSVDYLSSFTTQLNFGHLGRLEYDGNGGKMTIANRSTQAGSSYMRFVMGTTEFLRIDDEGNVGIGTTSPAATLDISGTDAMIVPRGTTAQQPADVDSVNGMIRYDTDEGKFQAYQAGAWQDILTSATGNSASKLIDDDDDTQIQVEESSDEDKIRFDTAGTERMIIDETGKVGIGTDAPSQALSVAGQIGAQGLRIGTLGDADTPYIFPISINSTSPDTDGEGIGLFSYETNGTTKFGVAIGGEILSQTSGAPYNLLNLSKTFSPSSGAVGVRYLNIDPTLNQTGTASGNVFGIRYAPTVTSVLGTHYGAYIAAGTNYFADDVGIGTDAPSARLDVVGADVTGSDDTTTVEINQTWNTTGTPTAFLMDVTDTASGTWSPLMHIRKDGDTAFQILKNGSVGIGGRVIDGAAGLTLGTANPTSGAFVEGAQAGSIRGKLQGNIGYNIWVNSSTGTRTPTSGESGTFNVGDTFNPTSGTGVFNAAKISSTINQTGGANGITRGIFVDPTLTAAADFRAVEMSNDEGFGIYQSGSNATNYFAGNVGFGTTSASNPVHAYVAAGGTAQGITIEAGDSAGAYTYYINSTKTSGWTTGITGSEDFVIFDTDTSYYGLAIDSATNYVGIGTSTPQATLDIVGTDAMIVPRGTTAQQPADVDSVNGMIRYDTDEGKFQAYQAGAWQDILTSAAGNVATKLADDDGNTQIQVEESPNEDKIRFDTAGSERMIIDETGNVGIGTTSPATILDISKATTPTVRLTNAENKGTTDWAGETVHTLDFYTSDPSEPKTLATISTIGSATSAGGTLGGELAFSVRPTSGSLTEAMRIDETGNVGIGTTSPAATLEVNTTSVISSIFETNGNDQHFTLTTVAPGDNVYTTFQNSGDADNAWAIGRHNSGAFHFKLVPDAEVYTTGGSTLTYMVLDETGNVGIGATSPATNLHVVGSTGIRLENAGPVTLTSASSGYLNVKPTSNYGVLVRNSSSDSQYMSMGVPGAYGNIRYNETDGIIFASNGNLGSGTTAPSSFLDIEKSGTAKANTNFIELTNDANAADMDGTETSILFNQYYYDATTPAVADAGLISVGTETDWTSTAGTQNSYMAFSTVFEGTAAEAMRIDSEGRVGIGMTTPAASLEIAADASLRDSLQIETHGGFEIDFSGSTAANIRSAGGGIYLLPGVGKYLHLGSNNVNSQAIVREGRFGVGTTTPAAIIDSYGTTEQIRASYDASNYFSTTVASTGDTTFDLTGTTPEFTFSDKVNLLDDLSVAGDLTVTGAFTADISSILDGTTDVTVTDTAGDGIITMTEDGTEIVRITGGNVGIGTTTPGYELDLVGSARITDTATGLILKDSGNTGGSALSLEFDDDADTRLGYVGFTSGSADLRLVGEAGLIRINSTSNPIIMQQSGQNVGIGIYPTSALDVQKDGTAKANLNILELTNAANAADMDATSTSILFNQFYYDATTPAVADAGLISVGTETDWTSTAADQDSYMAFSTVEDGTAAEAMRITSGGNVGIGTDAPTANLEVRGINPSVLIKTNGGAGSAATDVANLQFLNDTNQQANIELRRSDASSLNNALPSQLWVNSNGTGGLVLNTSNASGNIDFVTNGFPTSASSILAMRIDPNGNVGIGTTTPEAALDVAGTDAILFPRGDTSEQPSSPVNGMMRYNTDNGKFEAYQAGAWQDILTSAVGNAATKLIDDDGDTQIQVEESSDEDIIRFDTAGTERMVINASGNVGIGTNSPSTTLNVDGTLQLGGAQNRIFPTTDAGATVNTGGGGIFIGYTHATDSPIYPYVTLGKPIGSSNAATSGTQTMTRVTGQYNPTSGTGVFNAFEVINTINQTGGANGITRGIYVNPTLTAAADWRSIEITNNSGYSIYQSGASAVNYFAGNVGIGTDAPEAALDVAGTDAILFPRGDTSEQPSSPVNGMMRYNTDNGKFEAYQAGAWQDILTSAVGNAATKLIDDDGDTQIQVEESSDEDIIRFDTAGTERMVINADGQIGIATATPGANLHVKATSTDPTFKIVDSSDNTLIEIDDELPIIGLGSYASFTQIYAASQNAPLTAADNGHSLVFKNNQTGLGYGFYFRNVNAAGIGWTTGTGGTFNISNTGFTPGGAGDGNYRMMDLAYEIDAAAGAQTGTATGIYLDATETSTNGMTHHLMNLATGGTSRFVVAGGGRVGVGTDSPQSLLNLKSDAFGVTNVVRIDNGFANTDGMGMMTAYYTNTDTSADFLGREGFKFEGGTATANKHYQIYVSDASTPKMVVNGSGKVGIGTITPTAFLNALGTTEQIRAAYDASNYFSTTVASTGDTTLDLTGTTPEFTFSDDVNLSGDLTVTKTTEQIRAAYDGSNYFSTTVASTGDTTLDLTGTTPEFTFSDKVNITGDLEVSGTIIGAVTGSISLPLDVEGEDEILELNSSSKTFFRHLDTDDVLAIGVDAGAALTDGDGALASLFIGKEAGEAMATGNYNVFLGTQAGKNATSSNNTFVGAWAGRANTSGDQNTFLGRSTGLVNTTGGSNTFVGSSAGSANTSGEENVFLGTQAGSANDDGSNNVFIGRQAGDNSVSGVHNVLIGDLAGTNATGNRNTFIGTYAGGLTTSGGLNTFIGDRAGDNNTTGARNIIIGSNINNSAADTDDYLNIGNTIFGDMGTNMTAAGTGDADLTIDGDILVTGIYRNKSDERLKDDITDLGESDIEKLIRLRTVSYHWKPETSHDTETRQMGVIAQDVKQSFPELVTSFVERGTEYLSVNYMGLIAPIIEAIKELFDIVADLRAENAVLRNELDEVKSELQDIKNMIKMQNAAQTMGMAAPLAVEGAQDKE